MGFLAIDNEGADMIIQLINKKYENHSIIITTNKPFWKRHEIFGNITVANEIININWNLTNAVYKRPDGVYVVPTTILC